MNASTHDDMWLTVGAAAEVAGTARRSAFRWANQGCLPVRQVGRRRLVQVDALAAYSRNHGKSASLALFGATGREQPAFAHSQAPSGQVAALEDTVLMLQETVLIQEQRLAEIERLLGLGG
jgi:hypothetical protein